MQALTPWAVLSGILVMALIGYGLGRRQARLHKRAVTPPSARMPQAEVDQVRLTFLAEAATALAAGMEEPSAMLADLVRRAVPHYADACLVDLSALDPSLQVLGSTVPDPNHPGELLVRLDYPQAAVAAGLLDPQTLGTENGWVEEGYVTAPICSGNRRVGLLAFVAGQSGRRYGPVDLAAAEELAQRVMTTLERSLAYRQARTELEQATARAERMQRLAQLANALYAASTLPGLLRVAAEEARDLTGAERAIVTCWPGEPGSEPLQLATEGGLPAEMAGLCRLVCQSGQPLRMTRTELVAHPVFRAALTGETATDVPLSWMAMPIMGRDGRNLGLVQVFGGRTDGAERGAVEFSPDAQLVLAELCAMTGGAMENLRLWRASIHAEERLLLQLRTTGALAESMGEGVCAVDEKGCCTFANEAATELLGWTEEDLLNHPLHQLLRWQSDGEEMAPNPLSLALQGVPVRQEDELFVRKDGSTLPVSCSVAPLMVDGRVNGAVLVFSDMSGRKALEEQLVQQAFHDSLTGLPNRILFLNRLEHALARARRRNKPTAVLFVDLDGFKVVNDQLGHHAGDRLLSEVARRLSQSIRACDTAARLSGDEFTLLLEEVADEAHAFQVAERVRETLLQPLEEAGQAVQITASIGIAVSHSGDHRPDVLLRQADTAMYRAKSLGKNRCVLFQPSA